MNDPENLLGRLQAAVTRTLEELPGRASGELVAEALFQVALWTTATWRAEPGPRHWAAIALIGA